MNSLKDIGARLRAWLRGEARWPDERALDESAVDDPFLRDALAGYRMFPESDHEQATSRLHERLRKRATRNRRLVVIWRVAATLALLISAGLAFWWVNRPEIVTVSPPPITQTAPAAPQPPAPPAESNPPAADTAPATIAQVPVRKQASPRPKPGRTFPSVVAPPASKPEAIAAADLQDSLRAEEDLAMDTGRTFTEMAMPREATPPPPPPSAARATITDLPAPGIPSIGKVVDQFGRGISSVRFSPKSGPLRAVYSDPEGNYLLPAMDSTTWLVEAQGYAPQYVNGLPETVVLENEEILSEIVVTRSFTQKEKKENAKRAKASPLAAPVSEPDPYQVWQNYLAANRRVPAGIIQNQISGSVFLSFSLTPEGKPTNVQILRSLGYGADEEALRLLRNSPPWKPWALGGQLVIPVYFSPNN